MSDWKEQEISEEDEEFLQDIARLSEAKQNGIIAYIKNREKTLQAKVERLKKEIKHLEDVKMEINDIGMAFKEERDKLLAEKGETFKAVNIEIINLTKENKKLLAEKKKIIKAINDRSLNKIAEWEFMDIIKGLK